MLSRKPRSPLAALLVAALLAVGQAGCYVVFNNGACPSGQTQVCRSDGQCACGAACISNSDCYSNEVCAATSGSTASGCVTREFWTFMDDAGTLDGGGGDDAAVADTRPPRDGAPPVQSDSAVVVRDAGGTVMGDGGGMISRDGGASACNPACGTGEVCVTFADNTTSCAAQCSANTDCTSGCCAALTNGQHVCLGSSFCGAGSCGGYACYSDEQCVSWDGYGQTCSGYCASGADCASGCCIALSNGTNGCAPSAAYCGGSTCGGYTCYAGQQCVSWDGYGYACASSCASGADCASGCCIALSNGTTACAPDNSYCGGSTGYCGSSTCYSGEQCVDWGTSGYQCSAHCYYNSDCASGCCTALSDGSYVCAPDNSYCGSTGTCGGYTCNTSERCLNWSGYGDTCTAYCSSSADCSSGCCVALADGTNACAPTSSYCSSGTCGGYTCNAGELCVNWPGYGDLCSYGCYYNSDCASGCCYQLSDGSYACAPTYSGYCG